IGCAHKLLDHYADTRDRDALDRIVLEAQDFLRPRGREVPTSQLFYHVAQLCTRPNLNADKSQLADCALQMLALKLRQEAQAANAGGGLVQHMFPSGGVWSVPLIADPEYAFLARAKTVQAPPMVRNGNAVAMRADIPILLATAQAAVTNQLYFGFESGEIY